MEIHLNTGNSFTVPAAVADHLKLATHAQLKVLIYVLCHADVTLTVGEITRACGVTDSEVEEALVFWQNVRVICNAPQSVTVHVQQTAAPQPAAPAANPEKPAPAAPARTPVPVTSNSFRLKPDEIAKRKTENAAVSEMLSCAEQYAKKPLTYTELNSLIWMHEYLGLAPEVVLMLVAFCVETEQFQVRTMEHIAVQWQENGITSCARAEEDIGQRMERRSYTGQMMRLFGMAKPPTAAQQAIFNRWCALHMPPEMVRIAYDKMRDNISMDAGAKQQLKYMNGIIERWAAVGIFTPDGADQEDQQHRAAMQKQTQPAQPKRRTSGGNALSRQTSQSSIDLAEAEKLINQF